MEKQKWLGLHDHANFAAKWLDKNQPYSWLRAFEKCDPSEVESHALLAETYASYDLSERIRNVRYCFYKGDKSLASVYGKVLDIEPDVFFINVCWYADAYNTLYRLRKELPKTKFVIRVHHEVSYLQKQKNFLNVVDLCDVIIVPTENQKKYLVNLGFLRKIHALPFGVDANFFSNNVQFRDRVIDIVSFANSHPARNKKIINKVFARLINKGFVAENVIGLSRDELRDKLSNSKYMLLSSLTEASGSRILLEAISAGCTPIVFKECKTAVEVLEIHNCGHVVETGLKLNLPQKKVSKPMFVVKDIERRILNIFDENSEACADALDKQYSYEREIEQIYEILNSCNN